MTDPLEGTHPLANYPAPPPRGEDLPYDDGEPMESYRHSLQMNLLLETLDHAWAGRDDYFAGGNMFVYFSETQAKHNDFRGPDVFVVLNTIRRVRNSWVVWEEEGRTPDVVIELLSPKTERIDRGEKMEIYARTLKVSGYYLYDPWTQALEGYALDQLSLTYRSLAKDADGYLPCAPLGLRLGVLEGTFRLYRLPWLRWIDETGRPLLTSAEYASSMVRRADEEQRRADEEQRRADEEQRRADEEHRRADEEHRRADEEHRRADAEQRRADALQARLDQLSPQDAGDPP